MLRAKDDSQQPEEDLRGENVAKRNTKNLLLQVHSKAANADTIKHGTNTASRPGGIIKMRNARRITPILDSLEKDSVFFSEFVSLGLECMACPLEVKSRFVDKAFLVAFTRSIPIYTPPTAHIDSIYTKSISDEAIITFYSPLLSYGLLPHSSITVTTYIEFDTKS